MLFYLKVFNANDNKSFNLSTKFVIDLFFELLDYLQKQDKLKTDKVLITNFSNF